MSNRQFSDRAGASAITQPSNPLSGGGVRRDRSQRSEQASIDNTYSGPYKGTQRGLDPEQYVALLERRKALVDSMVKPTVIDFETFLLIFEYDERYEKFLADYNGFFDEIAHLAPSVVGGKVIPHQYDLVKSYYPNYPRAPDWNNRREEPKLVGCFKELFNAMERMLAAFEKPAFLYKYKDCQNFVVPGTLLKPDLAVLCKNEFSDNMGAIHMIVEAKVLKSPHPTNKKDLGQILDYVQAIWQTQITCKFVPVLLLHGPSLSLFVFTRNELIRVDIGDLFYSVVLGSQSPRAAYEPLNKVLTNLYFLLTLSPGEFGHICDFTHVPNLLCFSPRVSVTGTDSSGETKSDKEAISVLSAVSLRQCSGSAAVSLTAQVEREVGLHGRIAHIVKAMLSDRVVFLKLTWSAINRMPENAIYDILKNSGVQHIPQVYSCGLLIEDFRGYRLDYMVIEDCGVPLSKALALLNPGVNSLFVDDLRQIIDNVTACLVNAFAAGILHRDISDGNIAVRVQARNKSTRIIDWGYAKDTNWESNASRGIGRKWHYDSERVGKNEEAYDPITGTPRYMSISTLKGVKYRSVITDIESFFYVVLDALRGIYPTCSSEAPDGFAFHKSLSLLGHARASCLSDPEEWLADFGIERSRLPLELLDILEAMRRFLFYRDGEYIGFLLVRKSPYTYSVDEASAKIFMSEDTIALLTSRASSTGVQLSEVMHKVSPIKRTSIAAGGNVADTQHSPTALKKRKVVDTE